MTRRAAWLPALLLPLLLASCQPQPVPETEAPSSPPAEPWPTVAYDAGDPHTWRVRQGGSRVDIVVRRAGPLARFGHDHVLSTQAIDGWLRWDPDNPGASRGDLRVAVAHLEVDASDARARHELAGDPSADDIEGTRENLLEQVLIGSHWPWVVIELDRLASDDDRWRVAARLLLNGQSADYTVPVTVAYQANALVAAGRFTVVPSRHGIEPFSVLGGALSVADEVAIHFEIRARHEP